jgi:hypothetical protein
LDYVLNRPVNGLPLAFDLQGGGYDEQFIERLNDLLGYELEVEEPGLLVEAQRIGTEMILSLRLVENRRIDPQPGLRDHVEHSIPDPLLVAVAMKALQDKSVPGELPAKVDHLRTDPAIGHRDRADQEIPTDSPATPGHA